MAINSPDQLPRTTTELACRKAGTPYTRELQQLEEQSRSLPELAEIAKLLLYMNSLRPPQPILSTRISNRSDPFRRP